MVRSTALVVFVSVMAADTTIQVALIGLAATFITTTGVVIGVIVNNKKERTGASNEGVEGALRERLLLRDEQIVDLKSDVEYWKTRYQSAKDKLDAKDSGS